MRRTMADDSDWRVLHTEITQAFSPGQPIKERDLFAGRLKQIAELIDAVEQPGKHAVVFGERGVGKTSLANTFALGMHSPTRHLMAIKVNAVGGDNFDSLWRKVFRRLSYTAQNNGEAIRRYVSDDYPGPITPDDVQIELDNFSLNMVPIIVIDEFDRIKDDKIAEQMSDTVKTVSDYSVNCTIVLVGVANDVDQLISEHKSISRQLVQVEMPRMNREELSRIVLDRYDRLGLTITSKALSLATFLSRGLPYFVHLLGMYAARTAVSQRSLEIEDTHLHIGMREALAEVDQSLKSAYVRATASQRPAETLYEDVLLACALTATDDLGRFMQRSVEEPLARITTGKRSKRYRATTYAGHMNEFCSQKRASVLQNLGEKHNPRYRFVDPMMQPYVILKGLADGRIPEDLAGIVTGQNSQ